MPPSVWMQSLPLRNAASRARDSADAAVSAASPGSSPAARAASHVAARAELDPGQHVGALVLHALELADRAAELDPDLGVLGGGRHTPLGDAERLGGDEHRGPVADLVGVEVLELAVGGDDLVDEVDLRDAAGRVDARQLAHRRRAEVEGAPPVAVPDPHRGHQEVGPGRAEDGAHGAADPQPFGGLLAGERPVGPPVDGADPLPVGQTGQQGGGAGPGGAELDQRAGQGGGEERPGGEDRAELLVDDDELGETEAGAAVLLGQVQPEPALRGELGPERWCTLGVGVEERPGDGGRHVAFAPAARRVVEREVVFGDPDRHGR